MKVSTGKPSRRPTRTTSSEASARGGSTITQQLAKKSVPFTSRSYIRKGQELVITYMIEAFWDKRRILEVYLNVVEWGEGVFGAEAAARHYYSTSAAQLGPEQVGTLAAYLPNRSAMDECAPGLTSTAGRR